MLYCVAGFQRGRGTGKHLIASGSRMDRVGIIYFIFDSGNDSALHKFMSFLLKRVKLEEVS